MAHVVRLSLMAIAASLASASGFAADSAFPGVRAAMQRLIDASEIPGAVTLVVGPNGVRHMDVIGVADLEQPRPMQADTIFRIASMTKPVAAVALMMLQDEGRLNVTDPVAKFLPEFAALKTPSGQSANLTIAQLLSHTSGLGDIPNDTPTDVQTLAELIPLVLATPMRAEPGTKWQYCQSGPNSAARIVEVVSGKSFEAFLEERLFTPLGMKDTAFFPPPEKWPRLVGNCGKNKETGALEPRPLSRDPTKRDRPPLASGGLFSTAPDYARFCQMLLNGGALDGRRYLRPETIAQMTAVQTAGLDAGWVPGSAWGLGWGLVVEPQGITAMLSRGSFGHGGSDGTQAWIDPVKGIAYILMIQRVDLGNNDASDVRLAFQTAAEAAYAACSFSAGA